MARFEMVMPEEHRLALKRIAETEGSSQARVLKTAIEQLAIRKGLWPRAVDPNQPAPSVRLGKSSVRS